MRRQTDRCFHRHPIPSSRTYPTKMHPAWHACGSAESAKMIHRQWRNRWCLDPHPDPPNGVIARTDHSGLTKMYHHHHEWCHHPLPLFDLRVLHNNSGCHPFGVGSLQFPNSNPFPPRMPGFGNWRYPQPGYCTTNLGLAASRLVLRAPGWAMYRWLLH